MWKIYLICVLALQVTNVNALWSLKGATIFPQRFTKCFGVLGCLNTTEEWYNLNFRQTNPEPSDREDVNTKFILYTQQNPSEGYDLSADRDVIDNSSFNGVKGAKFVIHGFSSKGSVEWVMDIVNNLLNLGDWNVIVVDWSGGAGIPYSQAASNTRLVALEIAHLINYLTENYSLEASQVHLIGHSLGAHTAGYVGEKVNGLGRITGLDPAEPYFQFMPEYVRLDPSDAKFVDIIHTDSNSILLLGYGMKQPVGHLDFYPNGGYSQPGCQVNHIPLLLVTEGILETGKELQACSHGRASKLFIESLHNKCPFVGFECESYEKFQQGECTSCGEKGDKCAVMGLDADMYPDRKRTNVQMYLKTGTLEPYCQYSYSVVVQLASHQKAKKKVEGILTITLYGDEGTAKEVPLVHESDKVTMEHGKEYRFVAVCATNVGSINKVDLSWSYDSSLIHAYRQTLCLLCNSNLYVSKVVVTNLASYPHRFETTNLCSAEKKELESIESGSSKIFVNKC